MLKSRCPWNQRNFKVILVHLSFFTVKLKKLTVFLPSWHRQFRIIDDDGNKKLSMDEFKKAVRQLGMDDKDVKELFHIFDADNSGTIEFDEFLAQLRVSI